MQLIKPDTHLNFVRWMKLAMIFSAITVAGSLALVLTKGFNYGIDFAGGIEMRVQFPEGVTIGQVRESVTALNISGLEVVTFLVEGRNVYSIKAKGEHNAADVPVPDGEDGSVVPDEAKTIFSKLQNDFGADKVSVVSTDMVGPRVGKDLRKKGVMAIVYSLIGILAYIGWRFNFRYAPGAVVALAHDVLITCGYFVIVQHEMSLTLIAALLTIAGYSVNDTVIIFDRVREGATTYRGLAIEEMINRSLNDTLSRTLLTSGTTLLVILSLYLFGSEIIKDFALALFLGIGVGTYSTIFIASPIYIWLEKKSIARRKAARAR